MNWIQISSGLAFLLLGVAVYSLARLGGPVSTFAHTAALSLLTAGVLAGRRRDARIACGAWTVINIALEIGQLPQIRIGLVGVLPDWLERVSLFDRTRSYFMNGTFDYADIVAALFGGMLALAVVELTRGREGVP
jgi:hypothetical protein